MSNTPGYLGLITAHDPLYAYFKWDLRSNYKSNLLNTLGPWEKTIGAFSLSPGALTVVAFLQECFMGRIVGMIMCFWGTFFVSYFVVTVTNMLSFSTSEEKTYSLL